ncbi:uncharacterized protein SPPG_01333 [Spizellomyces punctatus DAOM BR117]|uniref:F-box domain-containing protein n=1 Tax=Spizellomyces punctatus (strain DAOM BR117) TaxID=645134 RepID=A0A0L0HSM4_SPIPD|nr:uncharacterized protein SPPG_01333 [Spizellomyces punctatus DAOM BR117]KND03879.1 hypothetical protein SPPG_01333 [Spizellomyces punctatus DAOM BR117]|eukprot:XP_016611918.1 hypothetical protein SPPG_01333 [Spizellomyces punctatus DAOM BR117]
MDEAPPVPDDTFSRALEALDDLIPVETAAPIDEHLPVEILQRIFYYLDVRSRCRSCRASRRWQKILYRTPTFWERLDLSNRFSLGGDKSVGEQGGRVDATLKRIFHRPIGARRFSKLTKLDLSCTDIDPASFASPSIRRTLSKSLSHLVLNGCANVDSGSLFHLRGLKSLRALDLSHCEQVDDTGLEVISFFLPYLTHLNLSYLFRVTERGVARLFRMSGLTSLNLMGCYRIKQYPWAVLDGSRRSVLPIREMMLGEDSRIQTRGFWLLWCTFNFDTSRLVSVCPFLEVLRLNMVLFDLPADGLEVLLKGCKNLKHLSLVIDRAGIPALCGVAQHLRQLDTLEATIHIGVTADLINSLIHAQALVKLRALKFHSKHTTVFNDDTLRGLIDAAPVLEYLELNGDEISPTGLSPVAMKLGKALQSLLVHHVQIGNKTLKSLSKNLLHLRELTITDLQQLHYSNRIRYLVSDPTLCIKLKKVELSSFRGFTDKDLALVPQNCPNLQWIDFSFSFTYPRTTQAITAHCSQLLYLRLCRSSPPPVHLLGVNRTSPAALGATVPNARVDNLKSKANDRRKSINSMSGFLASSPECRSLIQLAQKGCRRLRVMDITGNVGLTDYTLPALRHLGSLHTLFIDSCEGISQAGVVKFAEEKWKQLKRIHVRNCRNCKLGVAGENYLSRGLEVEVVVDGGRVLGRRWGEEV